jgi:hypothetical protein
MELLTFFSNHVKLFEQGKWTGEFMNRNDEFSFEIKEHLGVIATYQTGWKKELNLIQWNGNTPKLDIRDWNPTHEHMSRGITLHLEEAKALVPIMQEFVDRDN